MKSVYDKGGVIIPVEIHECDEDIWEQEERRLIAQYRAEGYKLLNIDKGGNGVVTVEKRSKSSLERCGEKHRKPIVAFNMDGSFAKEYPSITVAISELEIADINNIINVLKGRSKSASNYMWRYKDECSEEMINSGIPPYKLSYKTSKVYKFDIEGNLVKEYSSKKEAVEECQGSYNGLSSYIENKKYYHGGFWSYYDSINVEEYQHPFKYKVTSPNDIKFFEFQWEVGEYIGLSRTNTNKHLQRGSFTFKEYFIEKL